MTDDHLHRRVRVPLGIDLRRSTIDLRVGGDPCVRAGGTTLWRAWHSPDGPVTSRWVADGPHVVDVTAWGPGAAWAIAHAPQQVGAHDSLAGFVPQRHDVVDRAHRRMPHLRVVATGLVEDALVRTILGQKVTGLQASRAWRWLVRARGAPAPGPAGLADEVRPRGVPPLLAPPTAREVAGVPSHEWHTYGVEEKRAVTIARTCARIERMQEALAMPPDERWQRMLAFPGIGPWTAAIVLRVALGDADAVEVGDYHVPDVVAWNLAGEARADDRRMLELLAPFDGHRGRVVRLLELGGRPKPKFGPRLSPHLVERL